MQPGVAVWGDGTRASALQAPGAEASLLGSQEEPARGRQRLSEVGRAPRAGREDAPGREAESNGKTPSGQDGGSPRCRSGSGHLMRGAAGTPKARTE